MTFTWIKTIKIQIYQNTIYQILDQVTLMMVTERTLEDMEDMKDMEDMEDTEDTIVMTSMS